MIEIRRVVAPRFTFGVEFIPGFRVQSNDFAVDEAGSRGLTNAHFSEIMHPCLGAHYEYKSGISLLLLGRGVHSACYYSTVPLSL